MARLRSCNFGLELYPDNLSHVAILDQLETNGYQYSGILHHSDTKKDNPDELVKAHWHIVLCFPRQRDLSVVSKELDLESRFIECIRSRVASERYLCHLDTPDKFQYDPAEIFGPLADQVRAHIEGGKTEDDKVRALLFLLDTMPTPCSYRRFIVAACEAGLYSTLRRMGSLFKPVIDEHNGYTNGT